MSLFDQVVDGQGKIGRDKIVLEVGVEGALTDGNQDQPWQRIVVFRVMPWNNGVALEWTDALRHW